MQMSYSRVSSFETCPFKWSLRYIEELETIDKCDPTDALKLGTALHEGIELDAETAIKNYFMKYPVIDDRHENEAMKLRRLIPKAKELLPPGGEFEVKLECEDFKGFIDYLVPVGERVCIDDYDPMADGELFDIYDFKYSNNVDRYLESGQLHVYKYFAEKLLGIKIRNLYFLFVPKTMIRQKKTEELFQFRQRLEETLETMTPRVERVEYDPNKVIEFMTSTKHVVEAEEYEKRESRLCDFCNYQNYCQKGDEIDMALPSINRVETQESNHFKFWIYGAPFSGKTTFLDNAPVPLNLNTDGNVKNVTMARLAIKDTWEGRQRKFGWEILKEAITDLEKGSDFETVVVDLIEDTYEMCRLYMYDKLGISHESDDSFRAWDKVRTEYLSTMRKLLNLPYNIGIVSHEDRTKDFTSRTGEKFTSIKPNINDKVANKLAGMVDFVGRVVVKDNGSRVLSFKSNDVIFGGGRLNFGVDEIPLDWDELMKLYEDLSVDKGEKNRLEVKSEVPISDKTEEPVETPTQGTDSVGVGSTSGESEEKSPRGRRTRRSEDMGEGESVSETVEPVSEPVEESPKRSRRRRTTTE